MYAELWAAACATAYNLRRRTTGTACNVGLRGVWRMWRVWRMFDDVWNGGFFYMFDVFDGVWLAIHHFVSLVALMEEVITYPGQLVSFRSVASISY